jgi:hypothetical protein
MKESSTYQAIVEEGRAEGRAEGRTEGAVAEARKLLRLCGAEAFGPPDDHTAAVIDGLNDLRRLEELFKRLRTAGSWQELLVQATPARRRGRR